jgi:UEV domain/Vps23 core domain
MEFGLLLDQIYAARSQRCGAQVKQVCSQSDGALKCKLDTFVSNTGEEKMLLIVIGTVPIDVLGRRYAIPIKIWLPEKFPDVAPLAFVRALKSLKIKNAHPHVASNGHVYLPYLNRWQAAQSNLVELVNVMSHIFSQLPPLYDDGGSSSPSSSPFSSLPSSSSSSSSSLELQVRDRLKRSLELAGQQFGDDMERHVKLQSELESRSLALSNFVNVEAPMAMAEYDAALASLDDAIAAADRRLRSTAEFDDCDVGEQVCPSTSPGVQLLDAVAADAAAADLIYQLSRALIDGAITLRQHLQMVRVAARNQFRSRALSCKIHQLL